MPAALILVHPGACDSPALWAATVGPIGLRGPEGQVEPSGGVTCSPGRDPSPGLTLCHPLQGQTTDGL
eukprot:4757728-Karenia_brevis.AAC.1